MVTAWATLACALALSIVQSGRPAAAKVFDRCELAQLLQQRHQLPRPELALWVCIAQHSSGFNTAAYAGGAAGPGGGSHGLFQISDVYWCSLAGRGQGCNVACAQLRDDDLTDDLACAQQIRAEHQRIAGDGYTAWQAYQQYCRHEDTAAAYIGDCFGETLQASSSSQSLVNYRPSQPSSGPKIYNRCELAQELYYQHQMPMQEIPTWVCIAQHESNFDTSAVGRLNADGSADHGLFQISDLYWCSHELWQGGKACGLPCSKLLDDDITDDVRCIKRIHREHTHISGDGFTAWTVYNRDCRNQVYAHVATCFDKANESVDKPQTQHHSNHPNALDSTAPKTHANPFLAAAAAHAQPKPATSQSYGQTNPFLRQPQSNPNALPGPQKPQQQQSQGQGKVYKRCELAQEMYFKHKIPMQQIPTWVCIAKHESSFDTAAVGRLNADGSEDHGLFQINDRYWCTHDQWGGKGCGLPCDKLLDGDLADDVHCIRTIHDEHSRISGDGFSAWVVYDQHCRAQSTAKIVDCFDEQIIRKESSALAPMAGHIGKPDATVATGKVYKRCELAQELFYQHKMPMQEIPTWVCIAKYESSFNTAAVGRLNADGSADHGLFQISDLYWCAHEEGGGKACNLPCHKLLDNDISDDVHCIKIIHAEHTRISGDGFNAWTVYQPHCRNQLLTQLSDCFHGNEIEQAMAHGQWQQPEQDYAAQATTTTSLSVARPPTVAGAPIPNHPYASNLFLNRIKVNVQALQKDQVAPTTTHHTQFVSNSSPGHRQQESSAGVQVDQNKVSYSGNPFLNKKVVTTKLNSEPDYSANPFLSGIRFNSQLGRPTTTTTTKPTQRPSYATVKPILSDKNYYGHNQSKPPGVRPGGNYINSDIFRRRNTTTIGTTSITVPTSGLSSVRPHSQFSYSTARPTAVRHSTTTRATTARTEAKTEVTATRVTATVKPATTASTSTKPTTAAFSTSKTTGASSSKPTTATSTTTSSAVRPTPTTARQDSPTQGPTAAPPAVAAQFTTEKSTATKLTTTSANQQKPQWQWAWHATSTNSPLAARRKPTTTTTATTQTITRTTPKTTITKTTRESALNFNKATKQNPNAWSHWHRTATTTTTTTTTTVKPKTSLVTIGQTASAYNFATRTTTKSSLKTTTTTAAAARGESNTNTTTTITTTRKSTIKPTLPAAAATSTTTTPTRKPTAASISNRNTNAPTTTTTITTNLNTTKIKSDPFDHPFFAKIKEKFAKSKLNNNNNNNVIHSVVQLNKNNTSGGTLLRNTTKTVSRYYEKYRLNANESAKTIFSYAFGRNRTLSGGSRLGSVAQDFKQTTTTATSKGGSRAAKTTTTRRPRNLTTPTATATAKTTSRATRIPHTTTTTTRTTAAAVSTVTKSWRDNPMYTTTTRTTNIFDLYLNWNKRLG